MPEPTFKKEEFYKLLCESKVLDTNDAALTKALLDEGERAWRENQGDQKLKAAPMGGTDQSGAGRVYSDRWDEHGRQVVDLVQQGGGMLGIALVGYTYILERANLRFISLAGTSAGGINTMMLAGLPDSIYQKDSDVTTKSEVLAHTIANTNMSRFIDRKGIISWLIGRLINPFWSKVLLIALCIIGAVLAFGGYYLTSHFFNTCTLHNRELKVLLFVCALCSGIFPLLVLLFLVLVILGKNFGINSGDNFHDWVQNFLMAVKIDTTDKLMNEGMKDLCARDPKNEQVPIINRRLVLMTSNITYSRAVKFPEKAGDYWQRPGLVNPAEYVRATMSIPFFFQVYTPSSASGTEVILDSRFVDGGMLSNFPIREFHVDGIPRYPTFGIKLGIPDPQSYRKKENLLSYIGSYLSTFRQFYDNDYLQDNPETQMLVSIIDTKNANWLNFWMDKEDKMKLFYAGAKAACEFLDDFDWEAYKNYRTPKTVNNKPDPCKP